MALALFFTSCDTETTDDNEPEEPVAEDIIFIPDELFRDKLLSSNSIDTTGDGVGDNDIDLNNDGEIQRSEAEVIKGLIMNFYYHEIGRLVDFSGIENFINLEYLKITGQGDGIGTGVTGSELISYDFTGLTNLKYLEFNNLATNFSDVLDLSGLTNLATVRLINDRPHYEYFTDDNIGLPINFMDVNFEGTTGLIDLDLTNSFLNIDYCQIPSLKKLNTYYLEGGEPEIFDFHCLTNLEWLDISENRIRSLILKNNSVLSTLRAEDIGGSNMGNYPYAEHICIDDIPEEFEQIATLSNESTVVVTDCEF
ncbi:hypothetical protein DHB64_08485 [Antarcticibacterium sp. W02-3]|nr:hypothetical protein [Antarcticibacterium sp. W02-3]